MQFKRGTCKVWQLSWSNNNSGRDYSHISGLGIVFGPFSTIIKDPLVIYEGKCLKVWWKPSQIYSYYLGNVH
jgi:hypothetical protein